MEITDLFSEEYGFKKAKISGSGKGSNRLGDNIISINNVIEKGKTKSYYTIYFGDWSNLINYSLVTIASKNDICYMAFHSDPSIVDSHKIYHQKTSRGKHITKIHNKNCVHFVMDFLNKDVTLNSNFHVKVERKETKDGFALFLIDKKQNQENQKEKTFFETFGI